MLSTDIFKILKEDPKIDLSSVKLVPPIIKKNPCIAEIHEKELEDFEEA